MQYGTLSEHSMEMSDAQKRFLPCLLWTAAGAAMSSFASLLSLAASPLAVDVGVAAAAAAGRGTMDSFFSPSGSFALSSTLSASFTPSFSFSVSFALSASFPFSLWASDLS